MVKMVKNVLTICENGDKIEHIKEIQKLYSFHYKTFYNKRILDNIDSTVYNNKTNICSDISKKNDIYVEENKKKTFSLKLSAGNT